MRSSLPLPGSRQHVSKLGRAELVRYDLVAVAAVELPEEVRVLAPLAGVAPDKVKVGMAVELVVEPYYTDGDGNEVIAYKFRPA